MSALAVALPVRRDVALRAHLKKLRHPDAKAAEAAANWLSWLELGGAAEGTVYTYGWTVDKLLAAFPDVAFEDFTDTELLYVLGTTTKKSRARWAAVYKSWFNWGIKTRRLERNPCDYLPDFKPVRQNVVEIFTEPEEAALRALPFPDGTLMALLFDTGIRKSEACQLRVKRIDFAGERLVVVDGAKGGKQRVVPIDFDSAPGLIQKLDELITLEGIGPDEYLWRTRPGGGHYRRDKPITLPSMHQWWVDNVEAAGVPYRKLHTTRHTYATRWRQRGLDLGDIQILLGHSSIGTTQQIYVHQDSEDVRRRMAVARAAVAERG